MRGSIHQAQPPASAMIESLEGRMLLSADWVGTWQVTGTNLSMVSVADNGALAVTTPPLSVAITDAGGGNYNAVITTKVGRAVRTQATTFQTDATGLFADLTSTDTGTGGAPDIHWNTYVRMMQVDASVKLFDMTSVGHTDVGGAQRIYEITMYSGFASLQKLQTMSFPYPGNYSFQGFRLVTDTANGEVTTSADYAARTAVITQTGSKTYNIATHDIEGDNLNNPFGDAAGRLSRIEAGLLQGGSSYIHYLQMYYRGPDGRLYFRSGGMETNAVSGQTDAAGSIPLGQVLSGTTWAGYSDADHHNFAPALPKSAALSLGTIDEDQSDNFGTAVADILAAGLVTDWNSSAQHGIAITSTDASKGTWQYSTDGGASWQAVGKVSSGHALLLGDAASNRIRFVPKLNYNGTLSKAIGFRAWDQTTGSNGQYAKVSPSGNLTAFSKTGLYAKLVVNPVNDAPVLSGTLADLTFAGKAMSIGSGLRIADVDSKLLSGATVWISGGLATGDVLSYTGHGAGIAIGSATTTSQVQLTGNATLAAYVAAIRSITFMTSAATQDDRTISIQVNDAAALPLVSNIVTQTVHVPAAMSPVLALVFSNTRLAGDAARLLV